MTPQEFARRLRENRKALSRLIHKDAPKLVGVKALNFFREGYRRGGYVDGGFHPWPPTRRQRSGLPGAANRYGPLLSKRNRLFSATRYTAGDASVTVFNDTPYAQVHNEGGTVGVPVTPKSRKFFWAMYYKHGGKTSGNPVAERYKWMALSKKSRLHVKIPKRPFIYESKELSALIKQVLKEEIRKILAR